jgi:hypothetical protein
MQSMRVPARATLSQQLSMCCARSPMRRRMARTKNKDKVKDPFAFDSDAESDDQAKLSVK